MPSVEAGRVQCGLLYLIRILIVELLAGEDGKGYSEEEAIARHLQSRLLRSVSRVSIKLCRCGLKRGESRVPATRCHVDLRKID